MNRIVTTLAILAAAALPAAGQEDPVRALQKRVQETSKKVNAAFIFFEGGSGILISEDGYCLTNHHVVATGGVRAANAPSAKLTTEVMMQDGKRRLAELKCTDAVGDIALYKLAPKDGEKFPFVAFADSDKLEVGQYVLAIGAPLSIGAQTDPAPDGRHYPSVSLGIISALHRYQQQYGDCIQTDAAVNPGNSGGPLVDLDGKLCGINGRILTRYMNRVNSGVGFAIPANQIANFLPRMKEGGINRKVYHGTVTGLDLHEQGDEKGEVKVRRVEENSLAADRGFLPDDAILSINGHKVFNRNRFRGILSTWPADSEVTIKVRRGDKTLDIKVALEGAASTTITGETLKPPPKNPSLVGATFEDETPGKDGPVRIADVTPLSPAEEAGLRTGDLVLKVDGRNVKNRKDVLDHLQTRKAGETVTLRVQREDDEFDFKVKLGQVER